MKLPVHINNITDSKSTVEELSSQLIGIVNSSKINNAIPLDLSLSYYSVDDKSAVVLNILYIGKVKGQFKLASVTNVQEVNEDKDVDVMEAVYQLITKLDSEGIQPVLLGLTKSVIAAKIAHIGPIFGLFAISESLLRVNDFSFPKMHFTNPLFNITDKIKEEAYKDLVDYMVYFNNEKLPLPDNFETFNVNFKAFVIGKLYDDICKRFNKLGKHGSSTYYVSKTELFKNLQLIYQAKPYWGEIKDTIVSEVQELFPSVVVTNLENDTLTIELNKGSKT